MSSNSGINTGLPAAPLAEDPKLVGELQIIYNAINILLQAMTDAGMPVDTVYTVATLPTGTIGMRALVTDASGPTFLAAPVGGGAVRCPVFYTGSVWRVG